MRELAQRSRWRFGSSVLIFNTESGRFENEKDWEQFDSCKQCRGGAQIDETPDGDLVCHVCKAQLPRPNA
jgi:hypothetical protein